MANLAYIQTTRLCNQKCLFCSNPPSGQKDMSLKRVKELIDDYRQKKYEGLIISGGEPTIYPHLEEVIRYCRKNKFACRIITNGQKISDNKYLKKLAEAGLEHIGLSIYSHLPQIQNYLSQNDSSLENIIKALDNLRKYKIRVDINITINKKNSDHLSKLIKFILDRYEYVEHFIFNNLDPTTERIKDNPDLVPKFSDFEVELVKALNYLQDHGKTFRVERVPLCYLPGFEFCSTETRKIVKQEIRPIYFLDKKGLFIQKDFLRNKPEKCKYCSLVDICAGICSMDKYYNSSELYPVFTSKADIIKKILENNY
jgi:radical SAM protein with 4Fe4S-binding SPASM domain